VPRISFLYILFTCLISSNIVQSDSSSDFAYTDTFIADTTGPVNGNDVVKITRSWELPPILRNISAIHYIGSEKMACLQDEIGSIFIFNLDSGKIEKEIPFGPPGDYEGLVTVNKDAYVACADGRILEIRDYNSEKPEVIEYGTHLTVDENVNGLCHDRKNKRLLVSIKGNGEGNQTYKGIYAFNITNKRMPVKPAVKIDLRNRVFTNLQAKNIQTLFQPSDIAISPVSGLLYVIDGTRVQLLRMRLSENIRDLYELNREKFNQPEGISFTPSGELFIASKGVREEPGMLLQVRIK
jgi:hypothetical protein